MLIKKIKRLVANVYPNTPTVAYEIIDGKKGEYDNSYHNYPKIIKAFVEKRFLSKEEVCSFIRAKDVYN